MLAETIAVGDGLPTWALVLIALAGPAGLGGAIAAATKLANAWLTIRRDERQAREVERTKREAAREEERKAFVALPGAVRQMGEDLGAKIDGLGNEIRKALEVVTKNEQARVQADAEQRAQMAALMIELSDRILIQPRPEPPSRSSVRRSAPAQPLNFGRHIRQYAHPFGSRRVAVPVSLFPASRLTS
jgi:hypothetical protein